MKKNEFLDLKAIFFGGSLLAGVASADDLTTTNLFRKGDWFVDITVDEVDGGMWCSAETVNPSGQTFSITAYDSNQLILFVFDRSWNIPERPVRFLIDIDYSRWTMDGFGNDISVSVTMNKIEVTMRFLRQLMNGNAVALLTADERRLATFSLSGSYAAISNLSTCWSRIRKNESESDADPFSSSTDPF